MAGKAGHGGPKPKELAEEMRKLDMVHGLVAYRKLVDLMHESHDETVQMQAAKCILEHARGKPKQTIDVAGGLQIDLLGQIDKAHDEMLRKRAP